LTTMYSPWDIQENALRGSLEGPPSDYTNGELQRVQESMFSGLSTVLQMKDLATDMHSGRLAEWAVRVAGRLGLDPQYQRDVETAARLHDIGKIGIPDVILHKPGALTRDERLIINKHAEYGWNALRGISGFERVSLFVLHHHERIDGKGYPARLKGEAIPLGSRIISLIDAFDAMISNRCYRKALPLDEAVRRLESGSGTQFDPKLVEHLVWMVSPELPQASRVAEAFAIPELTLAEATF
jgi:HD-GYP domain-containing protein (c-di-GMP phosphodiesterase class II)